METTSQNAQTKKPGRPPVFTAEFRAAVGSKFPNVRSERAIANRCYGEYARQVLAKHGETEIMCWLESQPTIMSELGRIEDELELLKVAEQICNLKPSAHAGALLIRGHRKGGLPDPGALADCLIRAINRFRFRHRNCSAQHIREAFQLVLLTVEGKTESDPKSLRKAPSVFGVAV